MHESLTLEPIFYRTNKIKPLALLSFHNAYVKQQLQTFTEKILLSKKAV